MKLIGRALNATVAHLPWLWPVLKRPMTSYFDDRAITWDERTGAPGVDHLAPLAVAVTKIDRRPERALDIGTGTGVAALFVAREFPFASVRGVDVSEEMIRRAKAKGLPYLYLGYWVDGSKKMGYKARFTPQERLLAAGWARVE